MLKRYPSLTNDVRALRKELESNPTSGIDLGHGLRKIRMRITSKGRGRGKSGGARVITFTVLATVNETEINLLYIYDKAERESITTPEPEAILHKCGLPTDVSTLQQEK